jgi:hypothetical protein
MKRKKTPKPRNPYVQHLVNRSGGGVHERSRKAERAKQKAELRKQLGASAKLV